MHALLATIVTFSHILEIFGIIANEKYKTWNFEE
jgi:hypothetical protein